MKTLRLIPVVLAAAGCRREAAPAPTPTPSSSSIVALSPPAGSALAAPSADASPPAPPDRCAVFLAATGPRRLAFATPGDPAAHPGCAMTEAGELQCAEDFAGWTPRSKVDVPRVEARGLLDDAERLASTHGCEECPRDRTRRYPAGYDPSAYPARLCRGTACIDVCEGVKDRMRELRTRFAATKRATSRSLAD